MNKYQQIYYAWLDSIGVKVVRGFEFDDNDRGWVRVENV